MKIAFLNITFGAVDRGAETFVLELSERLKRNNKVDVLTENTVIPKRIPILWRLFLDPPGLKVLWFTLKNVSRLVKEKYDVVIPVDGGWEPAIVRIVTWLYGGKMVISGQSGKGWDDRNNLWCFPDCFIALSSRLTDWARRANPFIRVEYIPNGVDLMKFNYGDCKGTSLTGAYSISLKKPIVLCVGALTSEKRIDLAIKAVAKLNNLRMDNHPRGGKVERSGTLDSPAGGAASLLVVGDGDLKDEIQQLGQQLLGGKFQLLKLPFSEMPKVYRLADVFTLPSVSYQSFEIVLVEAMASGLPVVANDDPIRKEIVGDAGFLVDPTNTEEYAKAIQKALDTNWGNKPRKQAEKFNWDKIAEKYVRILSRL